MRDKSKLIMFAIGCVTLIIFGILFWPTLYRYDKHGGKWPIRINRITGYTEMLTGTQWTPVDEGQKAKIIPIEEKDKIIIKGDFDGKGNYEFNAYNGSNWTVKKIRLYIKAKDIEDNIMWQRLYEVFVNIPPFSKRSSSLALIDYAPKTSFEDALKPVGQFLGLVQPDVRIEEVFGYKEE